ncbi:MAG: DUF1491 family protein [Bauldia sp.]
MRLKSALFVSAHIRRCAVEGVTAVLTRRGAEEAGAIFVIVDRLDGTEDLYAPAPQSAFEDRAVERLFQRVIDRGTPPDIMTRIGREVRFDPDLWVLTIEDRDGRTFLDVVEGE